MIAVWARLLNTRKKYLKYDECCADCEKSLEGKNQNTFTAAWANNEKFSICDKCFDRLNDSKEIELVREEEEEDAAKTR